MSTDEPQFQTQQEPLEAIGPSDLVTRRCQAAPVRPPQPPPTDRLSRFPLVCLDRLPDPAPKSNRRYKRSSRLALVFLSIIGNWCVEGLHVNGRAPPTLTIAQPRWMPPPLPCAQRQLDRRRCHVLLAVRTLHPVSLPTGPGGHQYGRSRRSCRDVLLCGPMRPVRRPVRTSLVS